MLRDELDYPEEISLLGEEGKLLYDIDFDDLLEKEMKEVGLIEGRTLTVVDEETNRVNLELFIAESDMFITPSIGEIPKKPPPPKQEPNGVDEATENGLQNGTGKKRGREDDIEDVEFRKKARVAEESNNDVIIIDDDDTVMID
jgi:ubiquitin-like 1-activating enzyme E1 B